jgi:type I restriction enzyme S subunit
MLGGGTPSKENPSYWTGDIPWVSPKDMKTDRIANSQDRITQKALEESSVKMIPREAILFVVRGMILNHTLPVAITESEVTLNQDMKALIPELTEMGKYLLIASKHVSQSILFEVKVATHGTRRLETPVLKNWAIPLPPMDEQREIVRHVETLFQLADQIEARYQRAKPMVDKLQQSILSKAFRGELVPTEAELARREGRDYEPASVLLERIKSERVEHAQGWKEKAGSRMKPIKGKVSGVATSKS